MNIRRTGWVLVLLGALLIPQLALAQTAGSIAGTVKDASGGVLPGATVEAASPALIEKVRTVVTDDQGNYKVVDLRPGTYTVTVTLPGFSTYKREGLELSVGFTANVNADLKVGSLEETVTVTGATPIVDVQSTRAQNVLKIETMNQLPTGAKNLMAYAAMTLGAMPSTPGRNDVGGDKGEQSSGIILHGGRGDDGRTNWDGMSTNVFFGGAGGQQRTYYFNTVAVQEVVVDAGGSGAETETGGANVNMVPKEGGNKASLYGIMNYTSNKFSTKTVPSDLKTARNILDQSSLKTIYDYGVGVGGPIKQDKIWYYGTHRSWGAQNYGANNFFDKKVSPYVYTPDLTQPAYADTYFADDSFRITAQLTAKSKINNELHLQHGCSCWLGIGGGSLTSPEATTDFNYGPQWLEQTTWSYTATNKLLIQVGASFLRQEVNFVNGTSPTANKIFAFGEPVYPGPKQFNITEQTTGYQWGALPGGITSYSDQGDDSNNFNQRLSVSYVTGSHAFKAGAQTIQGHYYFTGMQRGVNQESYVFRNGAPILINQFAGPFQSMTRLHGEGFFAQDQWTLKRLTVNGGVRYDHFNGRPLDQDIPAGKYRPAFHVAERKNLPDFKDVTYRVGVAYDLFGNGKTAVKGSWGKYLMGQGGSLSQQGFAPSVAIVASANRTWTDANGNFVPDCDLKNFTANGECGNISNPLFGQPFSAQTLKDDVREGWGNREFSYQWNLQLQQELRPGLGLALGYFHTQWGNMSVTRNTRVTAADFDTYCITAPSDTRLRDVSGKQICGYYDITPAGLAKGTALEISQASNFGKPEDFFNGVDVGVNYRFGKGALINGGVSMGRETFDFCYANSHPELTPQNILGATARTYPRNSDYCKVSPKLWDGIGSQAKIQVVYPLPYDITVSAAYKNLPGIPITANYILTNAALAPILGRNLALGAAATATHAIVPAQGTVSATLFDQRLNQTDVRLSKTVKVGGAKLQGVLDLYNVMNSRVPQAINATYGASFLRPSSLLGGRLWKFGLQVNW